MAVNNNNNVTGWTGWVYFAGFMMIINGVLQGIAGLTALLNNEWLVVTENKLLLLNFTTWGWVHLLLGVVILMAGFYVMHGAVWARAVGVILASLGVVINLAYVNAYPLWSLAIILIDVLVIYALTVHGGEVREK
ncbi:hypothetical protein KA047_02425 [Candidatus Saccharibacteria bacterium]|nr:hypothetical protein [Candidatus Saccharibacteria bacterium]